MMKKLIIILAITLVTTSALAAGRTTQELCSGVSEDARKLMDARQAGVPKWLTKSYNRNNKIAEYMIIRAYEYPIYPTEEKKQQSITSFAKKMRSECYEAQQ